MAALFLLLFVAWNGGAILYPDSHEYLSRPANLLAKVAPFVFQNDFSRDFKAEASRSPAPNEGAVKSSEEGGSRLLAGRSPYWGVLAFLCYTLLGFLGIQFAQAVMLGFTLAVSWRRGFGLRFDWRFYMAVTLVATITAAGVFVALITPDLLAPALILAMALMLMRWTELGLFERLALCGISTVATLSHDSHIPVAFAAAIIGISINLFGRKRVFGLQLVAVALPIVAGLAGMVGFDQVAKAQTGFPPTRLPFATAHVSDLPAGRRYLDRACPDAGYEICRHLPALDRGDWIDFLFASKDRGGVFFASDQSVRDRLSAEQGRVLVGALNAYPVEIGGALIGDSLRQLVVIDLNEIAPSGQVGNLRLQFRDETVQAVEQTRSVRRPDLFRALSDLQQWVALAAALMLALLLWARRTMLSKRGDVLLFILVCIVGIVANGLVCGLVAAPLGRFQARVVFLLLFLGIALLALVRSPIPPNPDTGRRPSRGQLT